MDFIEKNMKLARITNLYQESIEDITIEKYFDILRTLADLFPDANGWNVLNDIKNQNYAGIDFPIQLGEIFPYGELKNRFRFNYRNDEYTFRYFFISEDRLFIFTEENSILILNYQ